MSLSGQWIGKYSGSNAGTLVVEIDDAGDHYEGAACVWDDNPQLPSSLVRFATKSKDNTHHLENLPIIAMNAEGQFLSSETLQKFQQQGGSFPTSAEVDFTLVGTNLSIQWKTAVGTHGGGSAITPKTRGGEKSDIAPLPINTWSGFKDFVNGLERKRYVFRGQRNNEWRLRSSFYRTGRANIEKYLTHDIRDLHKSLSALTRFSFDLNNPLHYGAFVNLVQHHGYPTPLLDWTWSPYVAAFFAFKNIQKNTKGATIRIFKFDILEWNKIRQFDKVFPAQPHVSVLDALAFDNSRVIPQQSISTISNIDDIETHIRNIESIAGKKYIEVIDLPADDREGIIHELALMGITAGSLFPGLEGACESLRERNF